MNPQVQFMRRCLTLASQGANAVAPNPRVGAVIVKDGEIVGEGYHTRFGAPHAEIEAINDVKDRKILSGSTLFVSLEPCCHHGKTPPCTDAIIAAGISEVVIGCRDPSGSVLGRGVSALQEAGISVTEAVLEAECIQSNIRFFTAKLLHRPYLILKWAETSDGFIARDNHSSQWISNMAARTLVHQWRAEEQAIMVGTNTAFIDNPQLTVRYVEGKNPTRVVIDRELKLRPPREIFSKEAPTIIFNGDRSSEQDNLRWVKIDFSHSVLPQILNTLYKLGVYSLIVEGGQTLLQSLIEEDLWDEIRLFKSNKAFGTGLLAPRPELPEPELDTLIEEDKLTIYYNRWPGVVKTRASLAGSRSMKPGEASLLLGSARFSG